MKKSHILAVFAFIIICFGMFFIHKNATTDVYVDEPVITPPTILDVPPIEEDELGIENSDIGYEHFTSTYYDDNDEILVNCSATLPKTDQESEFADNFNEYYDKILSKVEAYRDYEGSDLADEEKTMYGEDFLPIIYNTTFEIMYEDEYLISIKRETSMYSNETDFYKIETETFSKIDGTLVLITDICPEIIDACASYFDVNLSSLEDFNFNITVAGIWCNTDEIDGILPYSEINLAENYTYLGENNATD